MAESNFDLGTAELEVLKVLWDNGPTPVRQVMHHLHQAGRKVAYTTVQTFLTRLEQKGYATSDKKSLAFVYRAKLTRERVTRSRLKNLVQQLYDGAAGQLVLQLVRTERFTKEERHELQKLIEILDAKSEGPKS